MAVSASAYACSHAVPYLSRSRPSLDHVELDRLRTTASTRRLSWRSPLSKPPCAVFTICPPSVRQRKSVVPTPAREYPTGKRVQRGGSVARRAGGGAGTGSRGVDTTSENAY